MKKKLQWPFKHIIITVFLLVILGSFGYLYREYKIVEDIRSKLTLDKQLVETELAKISSELATLKQDDQLLINEDLKEQIASIEKVYADGSKLFEERADLVVMLGKINAVDKELAKFLKLLSEKNWVEAEKQAKIVRLEIDKIVIANTPKVSTPALTSATPSNELPGVDYSRQKVSTEVGEFVVSMVSATGARVVVETAGESDCRDNCPTKTLAEHVSASGGFGRDQWELFLSSRLCTVPRQS